MKHLLVIASLLISTTFNIKDTNTVNINAKASATNWTFINPALKRVAQLTNPKMSQYKAPVLKEGEHHVGQIKFSNEVNQETVAQAIDAIRQMNEAGAEVIHIVWNSPGGSVQAGYLLAQAIEESNATVVCSVDMAAFSMAYYLLQSCNVRLMSKRSELLIHEPAVSGLELSGHQVDFKNVYDRMHSLAESFLEQYTKRTKMSKDEMRKHIENGQDYWVRWEEALLYRMVDGIISTPSEVYKSLVKTGKIPLERSANP